MTMESVLDIVSGCLILPGVFLLITGAVGMLRMPDFYTRMHAAGMIDTGGASLILAGLMLQAGFSLITVKLLFIWVFIMFTSPTASHALAQAVKDARIKPLLSDEASGKR